MWALLNQSVKFYIGFCFLIFFLFFQYLWNREIFTKILCSQHKISDTLKGAPSPDGWTKMSACHKDRFRSMYCHFVFVEYVWFSAFSECFNFWALYLFWIQLHYTPIFSLVQTVREKRFQATDRARDWWVLFWRIKLYFWVFCIFLWFYHHLIFPLHWPVCSCKTKKVLHNK